MRSSQHGVAAFELEDVTEAEPSYRSPCGSGLPLNETASCARALQTRLTPR